VSYRLRVCSVFLEDSNGEKLSGEVVIHVDRKPTKGHVREAANIRKTLRRTLGWEQDPKIVEFTTDD